MAKERIVVKGIVLRSVDTKESDKILTVLTAERGKLTVVAKGARARRSRVTASTQLLAYSELTLSESHGWQYLQEGSPIALFDGVKADIELLALASYFAELVDSASYEESESGAVLSLLLNALYALGDLGKPQELVKAAFELKLMALIGFEPLADACAYCGVRDPVEPVFDIRGGVICCRACGRGSGTPMALTAGSLAALRKILYGDPKRLYSFTLTGESMARLSDAAEAFVGVTLERRYKTLDLYRQLRGLGGPEAPQVCWQGPPAPTQSP